MMERKLQRSYVGVRGQENTMCRHAYRKASVKPFHGRAWLATNLKLSLFTCPKSFACLSCPSDVAFLVSLTLSCDCYKFYHRLQAQTKAQTPIWEAIQKVLPLRTVPVASSSHGDLQTICRSSIQYTSIIAHGSDNTLHLRTVSCRTNSPTTDLQF